MTATFFSSPAEFLPEKKIFWLHHCFYAASLAHVIYRSIEEDILDSRIFVNIRCKENNHTVGL
jgi:hypothetical protein